MKTDKEYYNMILEIIKNSDNCLIVHTSDKDDASCVHTMGKNSDKSLDRAIEVMIDQYYTDDIQEAMIKAQQRFDKVMSKWAGEYTDQNITPNEKNEMRLYVIREICEEAFDEAKKESEASENGVRAMACAQEIQDYLTSDITRVYPKN